MPNANIVELEACIKGCLAYCAEHPDHEFVQYFHPRLERAARKFYESAEVSDAHFKTWARDSIDDKIAWKALGKELKATQRYLNRVNAVGYPAETVLHWDVELLVNAVAKMSDWLRDHADDVDEASERLDRLARLQETAEKERFNRDEALDDYSRHAQFRAQAIGTLGSTLVEFRKAMRRTMGKHSDEYKSIRWPFALAPDRPVI